MKGRRWRREEDQLLKEVVLKTIQDGGTQLKAFAEVGKKLGRTPGACGFRWNAVLRQMDPISYQEAKRKRVYKQLKKRKELQIHSFVQMMQLLEKVNQEWKKLKDKIHRLNQELLQKKDEYQKLSKENEQLKKQQLTMDTYREEVKKRYKELLQIIYMLENRLQDDDNLKEVKTRVDTEMDSTT